MIFLDVDGVLNSHRTAVVGRTQDYLDPVAVEMVLRLCREGNCPIALSSTWRLGDMRGDLERAGGERLLPYIKHVTPEIRPPVPRGEEIQALVDRLGVSRYVILDDDDDMLPGQPFVHVDQENGLSYKDYCRALWYLSPGHIEARGPHER